MNFLSPIRGIAAGTTMHNPVGGIATYRAAHHATELRKRRLRGWVTNWVTGPVASSGTAGNGFPRRRRYAPDDSENGCRVSPTSGGVPGGATDSDSSHGDAGSSRWYYHLAHLMGARFCVTRSQDNGGRWAQKRSWVGPSRSFVQGRKSPMRLRRVRLAIGGRFGARPAKTVWIATPFRPCAFPRAMQIAIDRGISR
jgi:hypothetical protein